VYILFASKVTLDSGLIQSGPLDIFCPKKSIGEKHFQVLKLTLMTVLSSLTSAWPIGFLQPETREHISVHPQLLRCTCAHSPQLFKISGKE
jgi:hypothetical protein